ncbi:hypothetical protein MMC17_003301 [Xylographa soralifera]|nr:hypothetical protein [Xylographa soralifera]
MSYVSDNLPSWPTLFSLLQSTSSSSWTALFVVFALIVFARGPLAGALVRILSEIINACLCFYNPIYHSNTGVPIPTCPYQWPNGQGNVAKFLEGAENRDQWFSKYGGIYRIWSGTTPEVVLTKPEHVQIVFRDSDKHHKAIDNNSGFFFGELLGQCVGIVSRDRWKTLKSVAEVPFLHKTVANYVDLVEQRTRRYLTELQATENLLEGLLDPVIDLKMLPFWVVSDILYGTLSPTMEQQLVHIAPRREELFRYAIRGGITRFRFSQYLPLAAMTELAWFKTSWTSFNKDACLHAMTLGAMVPIRKMYEAVDLGTISEPQLLHTLDEMLFANLDVTMGGISWNLVFLAANPSVQERLRREIFEQKSGSCKNGRMFRDYLLSSSSYLAACILESSRLKPLAAFSVPQSAPTERVIDGFRIPAGTNFIVDSHALNNTNSFWQPDSSAYRPERFLEQDGPWLRYNYWRFGFGPRQCMGKYVADLIIRVLLVQIVEGFQLSLPVTGEEWSRASETWINHPQIKLICIKMEVK